MDDKKYFTIEEFSSQVAERIDRKLFEDYGIPVETESCTVHKTNIDKQGITIRFDGTNVAPTVYIDDCYRDYMEGIIDISEASEGLAEAAYKAHLRCPPLPLLTPEEAGKHIILTVVNTELNQHILDMVPSMQILDGELSIVPRWQISNEASFLVTDDVCRNIGITGDEALAIGQKNIDAQHYVVKDMREMLGELMGPELMDMLPDNDGPEMLVITSESGIQGSNAIMSEQTLKRIHETLGTEYILLPASVHELIALPINDSMDPEQLRTMVRDINAGQLAPEERLSNNIMRYDGKKLSLVHDSLKMDSNKMKSQKVDGQSIKLAM